MERTRYFARCAVCGVEFEFDGLDTPLCCGAEMLVRADAAMSSDIVPVPQDGQSAGGEDSPLLDPSEPLEEDIVGPPEEEVVEDREIGILTGCFCAEEDWSFCSGTSFREEPV